MVGESSITFTSSNEMNAQATRYAVLRDHRNWDGVSTTGLQLERDGVLSLARIPGTADGEPITHPGQFEVASGRAVGSCGDLFIANTTGNRVLLVDGVCKTHVVLLGVGGSGRGPRQFNEPQGLLLGPTELYVADRGI